eukprot:GFUD01020476.1.p1 GENE.GFUD01020476.1~~GFUD01020476.1.p1  ORF type:complete len:223 (-),score=58.22 GFUD01020476.1:22-690(-)
MIAWKWLKRLQQCFVLDIRCHGGEKQLCSLKRGKKRACPACRLRRCKDSGMQTDLVLSGRKEALKHIGRANESTLARLKRLLVGNGEENAGEMNTDADIASDVVTNEPELKIVISDSTDNLNAEIALIKSDDNESEIDADRIPTPEHSPVENLNQKSKETSFISSLGENFFMSREKISIFSSKFSVAHLLAESSQYCPALVFASLQVRFVFFKVFQNFTPSE